MLFSCKCNVTPFHSPERIKADHTEMLGRNWEEAVESG